MPRLFTTPHDSNRRIKMENETDPQPVITDDAIERGLSAFQNSILKDAFTYHNIPGAEVKYQAINRAARMLAAEIMRQCPECPDRTNAIRVVREARMWANAAIACKGIVVK